MTILNLDPIIEKITESLTMAEQVRDKSYIIHREIIKLSGLAIRAVHRNDREAAKQMLEEIQKMVNESNETIVDIDQLPRVGFVHDAHKEFAEAYVTYSIIFDETLPDPDHIGVKHSAYLHGMSEAIGELRRKILDLMRQDKGDEGEPLLQAMEEIYAILVTMDFSDAVTSGLRRSTDQARGILERTRGDFTNHIVSRRLRNDLNRHVETIAESAAV